MARISYLQLAPEEIDLFFKNVTSQDRFTYSRITKKVALLSRKRKAGLSQRSLLPQVAEAWNVLSDNVKLAWKNAGAESNLNGYRLFVQDQCARIINEISGTAIPSLLHQSWVGQLHIESPASELKIIQPHPHFYWIEQKVYGKKGMYEPIKITEDFALPLVLSLNYKSELESVGAGAFAKFYADVWHSYQGADHRTELTINLDLTSSWKNAIANLGNVLGYIVRYDLYFHLYNVRGDLYIDNVKATHSAQNWVRDTRCNDINRAFTRAFYQVPKHWAAVTLPEGTFYETIYKDF